MLSSLRVPNIIFTILNEVSTSDLYAVSNLKTWSIQIHNIAHMQAYAPHWYTFEFEFDRQQQYIRASEMIIRCNECTF